MPDRRLLHPGHPREQFGQVRGRIGGRRLWLAGGRRLRWRRRRHQGRPEFHGLSEAHRIILGSGRSPVFGAAGGAAGGAAWHAHERWTAKQTQEPGQFAAAERIGSMARVMRAAAPLPASLAWPGSQMSWANSGASSGANPCRRRTASSVPSPAIRPWWPPSCRSWETIQELAFQGNGILPICGAAPPKVAIASDIMDCSPASDSEGIAGIAAAESGPRIGPAGARHRPCGSHCTAHRTRHGSPGVATALLLAEPTACSCVVRFKPLVHAASHASTMGFPESGFDDMQGHSYRVSRRSIKIVRKGLHLDTAEGPRCGP